MSLFFPAAENARLLKARDCRGLGAKEAFNFEDLRRQCDDYIAKTQQQASDLLESARKEAEETRQRMFDEAVQTGRQQGLQNAKEEIQRAAHQLAQQLVDEKLRTVLPAMQAVGDSLTVERDRWVAHWETDVVRFSIAIAEKLLRHQLEVNPNLGPAMVREALKLLTSGTRLHVRLHPQDEQKMTEFTGDVARSLSGMADIHLIADDTISPGGCLLETEHGQIDARLETQLQRIFAELIGNDATGNPPE